MLAIFFEFIGRVHRRERLADIFWGETEPDKARSALNTAIWRIRKIMELGTTGAAQHLITHGDDVILEEYQSIHVDTRQFEDASRRVLNPPNTRAVTDQDIVDIRTAVEGYSGPFLDGYDGDWVLQERERLHCLFVRSTFELMRVASAQRDYEHALDFGRRILAIDALRESIQRDMMLLLVLNGQRAEAIRTYQRLMDTLRRELDIEPMPETKRLYGDIVSGQIFQQLDHYSLAYFGIHQGHVPPRPKANSRG